MEWPYAWGPNIIDVQMFRVGQFVMIIAPTEATTMAGRRWRNAVATAAKSIIDIEPIVVLGGPANTYASYCATPEEYDVQRYEGASTLYGKWTLNAHINLTTSAISYLAPGNTAVPPLGPLPPDTRKQGISFLTDVIMDVAPIGKKMGQVLTPPAATYKVGGVVSAKFQAANPRNNLRLEGTFAAVEQQQSDGSWKEVRNDKDWYLVYNWKRTDPLLGYSEVTINWETANDNVQPGTYRIHYYGDSKLFGQITAFDTVTSHFTITA
jgi:neutral ceramidase